jgi:hypothetical protein
VIMHAWPCALVHVTCALVMILAPAHGQGQVVPGTYCVADD